MTKKCKKQNAVEGSIDKGIKYIQDMIYSIERKILPSAAQAEDSKSALTISGIGDSAIAWGVRIPAL